MRIALFAAALCLLASEAPRAQPGQTVTITGSVQAVQNGAVVKQLPEGGLWVYLVDKGRHHKQSYTGSSKHPEIRQRQTSFVPHVLVVPKGAIVDFPNDDSYPHNVFSPDPFFDLGRYGKGVTKSQKFSAVGEQEIYCDIHKCMWAHVKVVDVPDGTWIQPVVNGTYTFHVDPGTYEVKAWAIASDDVPSEQKTLAPGASWNVRTLNVQLGPLDLNHNNKTNQPYPPSAQQYGEGRCP